MTAAYFFQQTRCRSFNHVKDPFETCSTAIVWIRHFPGLELRCVIHQQMYLVLHALRANGIKAVIIVLIHGNDEVEFMEIPGYGLPGPQSAEIESFFSCGFLGTFIRWFTNVVCVGARGIHVDHCVEVFPFDQGLEDAMGGWGSTDIAHADKKNTYFFHVIQSDRADN